VDGVDLQGAHAADSGEHIFLFGRALRGSRQPLCGEHQVAGVEMESFSGT